MYDCIIHPQKFPLNCPKGTELDIRGIKYQDNGDKKET